MLTRMDVRKNITRFPNIWRITSYPLEQDTTSVASGTQDNTN